MSEPSMSQEAGDEPTIGDLMRALWRQRFQLVSIMAVCLLLAGAVLSGMMTLMPRSQSFGVPLRMMFPGAGSGTYPNGTIFTPSDLVAPTVVRSVHESLDVGRFMPYEDFKTALSVQQMNYRLEDIRREFDAKLSNNNLTQAERDALEEEYDARRSAAQTGEYQLRLQQLGEKIPEDVAQTILTALPETWAREAQTQRGAWLYDIDVPGPAIIDEQALASEDYLVAVDMLRLVVQRIDSATSQMEQFSGSSLVRSNRADGWNLVELRARLSDLVQFKIEPLMARIRALGVYRERATTVIYIQDRLFRLDLQVTELQNKAKAIDRVIEMLAMGLVSDSGTTRTNQAGERTGTGGSAIIPQFGEGFLDRLMELGVQTADVDFRRSLSQHAIDFRHSMIETEREIAVYKDLLQTARGEIRPEVELSPEEAEAARAQVQSRFADIAKESRLLIDHLQGIHRVLSQQNLEPHRVYQIIGPLVVHVGALSKQMIIGVLALFLFLGTAFSILAVWAREASLHKPVSPS